MSSNLAHTMGDLAEYAQIILQLRRCTHRNHSMVSEIGVELCYDCGSSRRMSVPGAPSYDESWFAPWIWRNKI